MGLNESRLPLLEAALGAQLLPQRRHVLEQVVEMPDGLVVLGLGDVTRLQRGVEAIGRRRLDGRLDLVERLAGRLGDLLGCLARAQLGRQLALSDTECLGGVGEQEAGTAVVIEAGPAAEAAAAAAVPEAEDRALLLAVRLDLVGLGLRDPAGLDGGVDLGVLGLREGGAQFVRADAEALGRVGEDGLLVLLVAAGGGDRPGRPAGDGERGHGSRDELSLHSARVPGDAEMWLRVR